MVSERCSDTSHSAASPVLCMPVQASSTSTRVPDQILDLAANLAAIDVSQERVSTHLSSSATSQAQGQQPTQRAAYPGNANSTGQVNHDKAQLAVNSLKQTLGGVRQETAEQQAEQQTFNRDLMTAMTELKQSVAALRTAQDGRPPGPTDSDGVAEALRDPAARREATRTFGIQWLMDTKEMWPADTLKDDEFMFQYYQLKHSGTASPSDTPLPSASANADLLASVPHPASVLGKAASDSLHGSVPTPSTAGTAFPFSAAIAGKHVKVDLPKPSKLSCIAIDSDIRAWLLRMNKYLTISGIEPNVWVVFASNYLDKAPLQLWEARKTQLSGQPRGIVLLGQLQGVVPFFFQCTCHFSA